MTFKSLFLAAIATSCISACGGEADTKPAPPVETSVPQTATPTQAPAPLLDGVATAVYNIEPTHASIVWNVSHNGLSNYTSRFTDFSAEMNFDADNPIKSTLTATINPLSVRTDHPDGPDWDTTLGTDEKWFNGNAFPAITYKSSSVTLTDENTGAVQGELTLLGVTKAVPLNVTFNGARNFASYGDRDLLGFSATATLKRSDFGITALLPGIGDEVTVTIEAEFLQAE